MDPPTYTLYYFQFSVFSLMARYTIALRGSPIYSSLSLPITLRPVDLHADENLSEDYLTTINPRGQVPTLTSPELIEPLTSTLEITRFLGINYPTLFPPPHVAVINKLLEQLHAIQPLSLSVPVQATPASDNGDERSMERVTEPEPIVRNSGLEERLARLDISETYRSALRYKAHFHNQTLGGALKGEAVKQAEEQAKDFLESVREMIVGSASNTLKDASEDEAGRGTVGTDFDASWIFGNGVGPTALDAHTIPFVARLLDVGRKDLVPEEVGRYVEWAVARVEWLSVTDGKPTAFGAWVEKMRKVHEAEATGESFSEWFRRRM